MKKIISVLLLVLLVSVSSFGAFTYSSGNTTESAIENSEVFLDFIPGSNVKIKIKATEINNLNIVSTDINEKDIPFTIEPIELEEKLLYAYTNENEERIDIYSVVGTYSLEYSKTDTTWDSSAAVQIWLEGIYEKTYFTDGKGVLGYKPLSINGKVISNEDPSQIEVSRMDLEVYTALGKYNLDGTRASGSSGMEMYSYYKNLPLIGTKYGGSPYISYYTTADYSPNFIGWINRVSLKRIPTGTTWEVQAQISIGNGAWE